MLGYLKRRLSSGDLQGEAAYQREQVSLPSFLNPFNTQPTKTVASTGNLPNKMPQRPTSTEPNINYGAVSQKPKTVYPSAPTSPTKSSIGFSTGPMVESITGQISNTLSRGLFAATGKPMVIKGKSKTVLILDEPNTDWSKYFRGRKMIGDWEIRVEQAQFNEINMVVFSEYGCTVDVQVDKSGTQTMRSFKPDFVVVRQSTNDTEESWKDFIVGLLYGGVPSLNTLHAIFNLHDRPWMYSHLMLVRNRLGRDNFPLIEQAYYPNYKEMIVPSKFPMVIKIGNCGNGKGKCQLLAAYLMLETRKAESLHTMNRHNDTSVTAAPHPPQSMSTGYVGVSSMAQVGGKLQSQMSTPAVPHDFTHSDSTVGANTTLSSSVMGRGGGGRPHNPQTTPNAYSVVSGSLGSMNGMGTADAMKNTDYYSHSTTSTIATQSQQGGKPAPPRTAPNPNKPNIPPRQASLLSNSGGDEGEDTMKNLRKTFAGIFGDM